MHLVLQCVCILALATSTARATLSLKTIRDFADLCVSSLITTYGKASKSLNDVSSVAEDLKKAEQARYAAYIESIDTNFLKCGVWTWTMEDFKKAILPASFFLKPADKAPTKAQKEANEAIEKAMPDGVPIKSVLKCMRLRVKLEVGLAITQEDADLFAKNFGDGSSDSEIDNEALLTFLRSVRCSNRNFDTNTKNPYEEIKKSVLAYYGRRLYDGFEATRDWVECMINKKANNIEYSDMWGCNGDWRFWNGPACLKHVKETRPCGVGIEEADDVKIRQALQKDTKADDNQAQANTLDKAKKHMLEIARNIYHNVLCRWSTTYSNAKRAAEAEQAAKGQKQGKRERKKRGSTKGCIFSLAVVTPVFAIILCLVGWGVIGSATMPFGCAAGVGGGAAGFFVGLAGGIVFSVLFPCDFSPF